MNDPEYWFPGGMTEFVGVRRLLPNHILDVASRLTQRFWPKRFVESWTCRLLEGQVQAAAARFPLALPITAGFDSRTILAAFSPDKLFVYTLRFPGMPSSHQDLTIPASLLGELGLNHHTVQCPSTCSTSFAATYFANTQPAHAVAASIAEGLLSGFPSGHVSLSGHASEIGRCFYYNKAEHPKEVTPQLLASYVGMSGDKDVARLAASEFEPWLLDAKKVESRCGVRVLDLFYWEQRVGSWAANGQSQWDIVHDRVSIFACREVLELMLAEAQKGAAVYSPSTDNAATPAGSVGSSV